MRKKLKDNVYTDEMMFLEDLKLIVSNSKTYNSKKTPYYKCADNIEKYFMSRWSEILNE